MVLIALMTTMIIMMFAMLTPACAAVPTRGRVDTVLSKCYIRSDHLTPYKSMTYVMPPPLF